MWMALLLYSEDFSHVLIEIVGRFDLCQVNYVIPGAVVKVEKLTAAARSWIARPAFKASSWLSLISTLITCTGRLDSPPRLSRSDFKVRLRDDRVVLKPTFTYCVKAPFLACYDYVCLSPVVLPSLWCPFYLPVSIQHFQESISFVSR